MRGVRRVAGRETMKTAAEAVQAARGENERGHETDLLRIPDCVYAVSR